MPGSGIVSISPRYAAALTAGSHTMATRAEVWSGDSLLRVLSIDATNSEVAADRSQAIRRTCSLNLVDPLSGTPQALVPVSAQSLLAPFGNELVLYRGITYTDGTQESIQQGVFGIEELVVTDSADDLVISVTGNDRSRIIQRAGFTDTYTIASSTNVGTAIVNLLIASWTGAGVLLLNFSPTSSLTPAAPIIYQPGDDPWAKAQGLAASIGYQLYFDRAGVAILSPVVDPKARAIAWSYDEGAGNIATQLTRTQSRANAPNYIIRSGEGSGVAVPVRGVAQDTNPNSPTYVNGTYGRVVDFKSSSLITTQAQANAAAQADLLLALGTVESLQVMAVPKPDHDIDDVIEVTRIRSGLASVRYVIDSTTLDFGTSGVIDLRGRRVPT